MRNRLFTLSVVRTLIGLLLLGGCSVGSSVQDESYVTGQGLVTLVDDDLGLLDDLTGRADRVLKLISPHQPASCKTSRRWSS